MQWACYGQIPVLTKQEILQRGHTAFFSDYRVIQRGLQNRETNTSTRRDPRRGP